MQMWAQDGGQTEAESSGHLNSGPPCSSPESRPSSDRVPVPTLVVTVTSLFPTSQVLVLPPARRNSPTGDLKAQSQSTPHWVGALDGQGAPISLLQLLRTDAVTEEHSPAPSRSRLAPTLSSLSTSVGAFVKTWLPFVLLLGIILTISLAPPLEETHKTPPSS